MDRPIHGKHIIRTYNIIMMPDRFTRLRLHRIPASRRCTCSSLMVTLCHGATASLCFQALQT